MALSTHGCKKVSKELPTVLPFVYEFRVMYLFFSDELTGKELQSVLGYPSLRQAPFIPFLAARKYCSWELVRRKCTPPPVSTRVLYLGGYCWTRGCMWHCL